MAVRLSVGNLLAARPKQIFAPTSPPSRRRLGCSSHGSRDRAARGFAFVDYAELADATEVIRRLNGQPFLGRTLSVIEARLAKIVVRGRRWVRGYWAARPGLDRPPAMGGDPGARRNGILDRRRHRRASGRGRKTRGDAGAQRAHQGAWGGRVYDVDDPKAETRIRKPRSTSRRNSTISPPAFQTNPRLTVATNRLLAGPPHQVAPIHLDSPVRKAWLMASALPLLLAMGLLALLWLGQRRPCICRLGDPSPDFGWRLAEEVTTDQRRVDPGAWFSCLPLTGLA